MSWLKVPFLALSFSAALCVAQETATPVTPAAPAAAPAAKPAPQAVKKADFKAFTGKVAANKVRLRIKPDVDSHIVRQFSKNDLLLIVGEEGDFYAVQPPKETKAYVFRTYVLDNVVEANRVNVRLEPHPDAPIMGQLQAGARLEQSHVCPMNHKWLEIAPPATAKFYVSKDFITQVGGPDYMANMEKRKAKSEELLQAAYATADSEFKKAYEEISLEFLLSQFQTVTRDYTDFPNAVSQAKEGIALVKQTYLQKKIDFLESKAQLSSTAKAELLAKHKDESRELFGAECTSAGTDVFAKRAAKQTGGFWDTIEESLYLSWTAFHSGKKMDDFYAEQKANASVLTGTIEAYPNPVKNRPGDFILKGTDAPVAYLYSTAINLEKFVGKQVTVLAAPRPNNHFAFPAYFVLNVE